MNINKYDTIILDCDGVIFDSNYLKINAFEQTLKELNFEKKYIKEFVNYFKNNFGISRYKLAQYFIKDIIGQFNNNMLYEEIINLYSKKSFELYKKASFTERLLEFLKKYQNKNLFIASGSDEEELREIFKLKKIDKYFINIFGSPKNKSDIVGEIVKKNKNSIMIGDAFSDINATIKNNIDFIFMSQYSTNEELKRRNDLVIINNLGELI